MDYKGRWLISSPFIIIIHKIMISLKVEHSHAAMPCHPTRAYLHEQASINETDREDVSDEDAQYQYSSIPVSQQFKIVESRAYDTITGSQTTLTARQPKPRKPFNTPEDSYHADVIEESFQGSIRSLPINIRSLIMQRQKLVEDKVYHGVMDDNSNLLGRLYEQIDGQTHFKDRVKENLIEMMASIHSRMEVDIRDSEKYVIHKIIRSSKADILSNRKPRYHDTRSLTFSSKPHDEESLASESHPPSYEEFSLQSDKTKQAEVFIKKIKKEQEQARAKRREEQERKRSLEVRSMEEKKQFEEQIKNERRNYLHRRIQMKKQIKEKQLQVREKMNKEYKDFLKKYKNRTPLFKKNELSYQAQLQEEEQKKANLLQQIRKQRKPMRIEELIEHEKKYKQLKTEREQEKSNEKKVKDPVKPIPKFYKSKCHEQLLVEDEKEKERALEEDPKLIRSELIKKRDLYSQGVRQNFVPKSDEAKQKELQQLMEKLKWSQELKKGKIDDRQHYVEGNKNLQRLHQLIADLKAKGKLPEPSKTISVENTPPKSRYENYLANNHQHRKSHSVTIDYDRVAQYDLGQANRLALKAEEQARRREAYIQSGSLGVRRSMEEAKKADSEYLESVRAKMAVLNRLEGL